MDDRYLRSEGLELLTSASRGALFNVIGTGAAIFERIEAELSGYYLLGVESNPADRDGKTHSVRDRGEPQGADASARAVRSSRRSTTGSRRARETRSPPPSTRRCRSRRCRCAWPPSRCRGPKQGKVQLLIHADVGTDYSSAEERNDRLRDHRSRGPDGGQPDWRSAAAAGDERRAVGAAVYRRRERAARRVHAQARRRTKAIAIGTVEHEFTAGVVDAGAVQRERSDGRRTAERRR